MNQGMTNLISSCKKKYGHVSNKCRKKKEYLNKNNLNVSNTSKIASNAMFVNCLEDQESNKHLWLLDNGYSNNMTCDMI